MTASKWMSRFFLLPVTLSAVLVTGALVRAQEGTAPPPPPRFEEPKYGPNDLAVDKFKNIKVLKDLKANDLIPVMRNFNKSLGVKCSFCHAINPDHTGFEIDSKEEKQAARGMIKLVNDLNKPKMFNGKATCFMCHHGMKKPETKVPEEPMAPAAPATPAPAH